RAVLQLVEQRLDTLIGPFIDLLRLTDHARSDGGEDATDDEKEAEDGGDCREGRRPLVIPEEFGYRPQNRTHQQGEQDGQQAGPDHRQSLPQDPPRDDEDDETQGPTRSPSPVTTDHGG